MTKRRQASATPLNTSPDMEMATGLCAVWLTVVAFAQAFRVRLSPLLCDPHVKPIIQIMDQAPLVGVLMGSKSDFEVMRITSELLAEFEIPFESRIVSAHRTPDLLFRYASSASERGIKVIIAGAGGAAHLPGMLAANTIVPVLGVPIPATMLNGVDSLLSIVQMPRGVPVGTLAIGKPGAANAAILAAQILGLADSSLRSRLEAWRQKRSEEVLVQEIPV